MASCARVGCRAPVTGDQLEQAGQLAGVGPAQPCGRLVKSSASPTVPIEASIPASIRWAVNAKLVYCGYA
jgi:hypothetical protein